MTKQKVIPVTVIGKPDRINHRVMYFVFGIGESGRHYGPGFGYRTLDAARRYARKRIRQGWTDLRIEVRFTPGISI